jgi:hypothetical protein
MTGVIFRETDNLVNVGRQASAWAVRRIEDWRTINAFRVSTTIAAAALGGAIAFTAVHPPALEKPPLALSPIPVIAVERRAALPIARDLSDATGALPLHEQSRLEEPAIGAAAKDQTRLEQDASLTPASLPAGAPAKRDLSYLAYYVYDEHAPAERPADVVLNSLKDVAVGTPVEEIKHAAEALGVNFNFMKAVAKIESDFDPTQRTGSYIGLFQLSRYEFNKYGSGDILNARDNAVAAAYKFITDATLFEWDTHKKPTLSDLYLIHQQGWQGAAEHVKQPERIAWKSMCATDEGKEKGEKWCKRAVWGNTLPTIKRVWKSVENLPSSAFVAMWRERVNTFYSRYSAAAAATTAADETKH